MMGKEFINNIERYCIWMRESDLDKIDSHPLLLSHLEACRQFRLKSDAESTRKIASVPYLFAQIAQPDTNYIALPRVSSQRRDYIPIGYLPPDVIAGDKLYIVPNGSLYIFGILTSAMHNVWMRVVAGRLKSDFSYTTTTVYNTFPWPNSDQMIIDQITELAQRILNIRSKYEGRSLASLYDPLKMPDDLLKAHHQLDLVVDRAYNPKGFKSDDDRIKCLFELYQTLTADNN